MSSFEFTAKRSLISGHSENSVYTFDQSLSKILPQTKSNSNSQTSLSGVTETEFHGLERLHQLQTEPMNDLVDGEYHLFREFVESVMDGQEFWFDAQGTASSPDNPVLVTLEKNSYKLTAVSNIRGTSIPTWVASITVREVEQ